MRLLAVQDLEVACRLAVQVHKQQSQALAVNATGCADDGGNEVNVKALIPMKLPVLAKLSCHLLLKVFVR